MAFRPFQEAQDLSHCRGIREVLDSTCNVVSKPFVSVETVLQCTVTLTGIMLIVLSSYRYGLQGLVYPGILNATASVIYTNSYYHFSSDAVGFAYFAAVVGMILGSLWVTLVGPWLVIRLARRRGGISEPEDILWLFLASAVVVPFALILWGVGSQHHVHWFALVFAQAILAISSTLCLSTAIQYATSAYRDLSGELITTIILIRNTLR